MQRVLLASLAHDVPKRRHLRADQGHDEWTTSDLAAVLSGPLPAGWAPSRYDDVRDALAETTGEVAWWWWDDVLERQVRRALDRLHAVGRVEKRLVANRPHYPHATVALWRLSN